MIVPLRLQVERCDDSIAIPRSDRQYQDFFLGAGSLIGRWFDDGLIGEARVADCFLGHNYALVVLVGDASFVGVPSDSGVLEVRRGRR